MPIYEYQCASCAHRFEVKQSIKDDPIKECVRCGKEVTKLISPPAIMFKGSGWYITDYSDKMKPGSGSDTSEKPAATGSDNTKAPAAADSAGTGSTATPSSAPAAPATTGSTQTSSASTTGSGASSSGSSASSSS